MRLNLKEVEEMSNKCSFCERWFIAVDGKVLIDGNNNTYCPDCAKKHFEENKMRQSEEVNKEWAKITQELEDSLKKEEAKKNVSKSKRI